MARTSQPQITLFPFLSVLMCAIGAMITVFVGTSLTAVEDTQQRWAVTVRDVAPRSAGKQFSQEPIYIICDAQGLAIYYSPREKEQVSPADLAEGRSESTIRQLVDTIARRSRERWPVFLVKPSGLNWMLPLYEALHRRNVPVGKFAFAETTEFVVQVGASGEAVPSGEPSRASDVRGTQNP